MKLTPETTQASEARPVDRVSEAIDRVTALFRRPTRQSDYVLVSED